MAAAFQSERVISWFKLVISWFLETMAAWFHWQRNAIGNSRVDLFVCEKAFGGKKWFDFSNALLFFNRVTSGICVIDINI